MITSTGGGRGPCCFFFFFAKKEKKVLLLPIAAAPFQAFALPAFASVRAALPALTCRCVTRMAGLTAHQQPPGMPHEAVVVVVVVGDHRQLPHPH